MKTILRYILKHVIISNEQTVYRITTNNCQEAKNHHQTFNSSWHIIPELWSLHPFIFSFAITRHFCLLSLLPSSLFLCLLNNTDSLLFLLTFCSELLSLLTYDLHLHRKNDNFYEVYFAFFKLSVLAFISSP